ncbi:MAG: hypothetical protein GX652_17560, partial [Burkholderiaceae bacterium]|nr:hypothetical protein [Burkholderiaceae bacterium]
MAPRAAALLEAEAAAREAEEEAKRLRKIAQREARNARRRKSGPAPRRRRFRPVRWLFRWAFRGVALAGVLLFAVLFLYKAVNPPFTPYILSEAARLGGVERTWVPIERIAPAAVRAVVAAEDANFCLHWGL